MDKYRHLFIIGAQRSGSTMLYGLLDQHPDISMARPVRPEPKYFINNKTDRYINYLKVVFPTDLKTSYLGEKSTSYYEIPHVAARIKNCVPNPKMLFIMRNPVQRALSNYQFSKQNGLEGRTMEEVFVKRLNRPEKIGVKTSVDPFDYLGRGEYLKHLKPYMEVFGKQNILPIVFEEFLIQTEFDPIWKFLNLPSFNPTFDHSFQNKSIPESVDENVIDALQKHFQIKNRALADYLNIDLGIWEATS